VGRRSRATRRTVDWEKTKARLSGVGLGGDHPGFIQPRRAILAPDPRRHAARASVCVWRPSF
jgi:hypothetical protein